MAESETLGALQAGGDIWDQHRNQLRGRADLRGADLRGEDLRMKDLAGVNLCMADLSGADLSGSDLSKADMGKADMGRAFLIGADLSRAFLFRADLTAANLFGADGTAANLSETNLSEANLSEANLRSVGLIGADMSGADLSGAVLADANLSDADLIRADLSGANLSEANLNRANVTRANLTTANLSKAALTRANLNRANLSKADLSKADLSGANLSGTDLSGADLSGADLSGANLSGANLSGTNLSGTNLSGTNLTETKFSGTQLGNLDLSKTEGLEEVVQDGPSTVGVDTLYRSRGEIPDKFLRGAGLTDLFITYARDTINAESGPLFAFYSAFLSYSHSDREPVRTIYDQLTKRGIPCWLDEHQLNPGDKLDTHIDAAIRGADKLVVFCSEASLSPDTNWWVDREVGRALDEERERSRLSKKDTAILVPVVLDGYLFSDECTYARKRDLTSRTVATHTDTCSTVDALVAALSTSNGRPNQPFFDPNRHTG